ncbi:MAG: hypothetical protein AAGI53_10245 [Planctomycetota bacterium]
MALFIRASVVALALVTTVGCEGVQLDQSSRLSIGDMRLIVDQTVQELSASDWIGERNPQSPPAVVTFTEMTNATDDVITRSELWYLAQGVANEVFRDRLLREEKNVTLVIPAARLEDARRRGTISERAGSDRRPTHTMTCRIDNIARSDENERSDLYVAEYRLVSLDTATLEWIATVEFERKALGRSFN